MFTNNKFGKLDAVADAIKSIAEADYKAKMEELKGQQHKIDKNKNNKIDADDFKILRGEKKGMKKEEAEQIDEISSTLANKYLNAPQGKGANKYKVGDTGTTKKNVYPDVETMSKHSKSVRQAIQRSGSSSIFKKPSYYKEEAEQIDEEINVKKDYDDHEQSEHGVYKGKRKIGYIVHNKKAGTHTAYHGHKYGKDDYENSDDFKSHEHALNQIKKSAGINESNNPFDVKNYKSQLPTKPGEKAGFDSKKVSTGTVYSRKPVKDEPMKKEEIDPNDTTTDTLKGREKTSGNPFLSKKVKMDVPDNVKEEAEQIDELKKATVKSYLAKKMASLPGKDPKKDQKDMMKAHHRVTGVKPTSEEVEQIDEKELTLSDLVARSKKHQSGSGAEAEMQHHRLVDGKPNVPKRVGSKDIHLHHIGTGNSTGEDAKYKVIAAGARSPLKAKVGSTISGKKVNDHMEMSDNGGTVHVHTARPKAHFMNEDVHEEVQHVEERTLTKGETAEKERIVKGMKKSLKGFKARYGERAKEVMYATATKAAKKD